MKNILAIIGAVFVVKYAYQHLKKHEQYKADANCWSKRNQYTHAD